FTKPQRPPGVFDVALQLGEPARFTGDRSTGGNQPVPFSQGTGEPVAGRTPVPDDRTLTTAPVIELIEQGLHTILAPRTVGPIPPPEAFDEITPIACVAQLGCQRSPRLLVTVEHVGGGGREVVHVCPTFVDGLLPRDLGGDVVDRAVVGRGDRDLETGKFRSQAGKGGTSPRGLPTVPFLGEG